MCNCIKPQGCIRELTPRAARFMLWISTPLRLRLRRSPSPYGTQPLGFPTRTASDRRPTDRTTFAFWPFPAPAPTRDRQRAASAAQHSRPPAQPAAASPQLLLHHRKQPSPSSAKPVSSIPPCRRHPLPTSPPIHPSNPPIGPNAATVLDTATEKVYQPFPHRPSATQTFRVFRRLRKEGGQRDTKPAHRRS